MSASVRKMYNSLRRTMKSVRLPRMSFRRTSRSTQPRSPVAAGTVTTPPFVSSIVRVEKNKTIHDELVLDRDILCGFVVYSGRIFINRYNVPLTPDLKHIMYKEIEEYCGVNISKQIRKHKNYPYRDSDKQTIVNEDILNHVVFDLMKSAKESAKIVKIKVKYENTMFPNPYIWDERNIQTNWLPISHINRLKEYYFQRHPLFTVIDNDVINMRNYRQFTNGNLVCLHFGYIELTLKGRFVNSTDRFLNINERSKSCYIKLIEPLPGAQIQDDLMHHINPYENLPISNIGSLDLNSPVIDDLRPDQYTDYIEDEITHHITSGLDLKIILLKTS
jgi:hypothetical protein